MKTRARSLVAIAVAAAVTLGAAVAFRAFGPRPSGLLPDDVEAVQIDLDETGAVQQKASLRSTDAPKVAALAAVLRGATPSADHKCASTGQLVFQMRGGRLATFGLLPSHDRRYYELRVPSADGYDVVRVERASFLKAMESLGARNLEPGVGQGG